MELEGNHNLPEEIKAVHIERIPSFFEGGMGKSHSANSEEFWCNVYQGAKHRGRHCSSIPKNAGWDFPIAPKKKIMGYTLSYRK